jgi:K(+)-stimulated pyrophosphate-energized sodium pump
LAFLKAEYRLLTFFVIGASIVWPDFIYRSYYTYFNCCCLYFGAFFSALAGNMGMKIAKRMLELQAARTSLPQDLKSFFGGGTNGIGSCRFSGFRIDYFYILPLFMNGVWTSTEDMTIV